MRIQSLLRLTAYTSLGLVAALSLILGWVFLKIGQTGANLAIAEELQTAIQERKLMRNDFYVRREDRSRMIVRQRSEHITDILDRALATFKNPADLLLLSEIIRENKSLVELSGFFLEEATRQDEPAATMARQAGYEKRMYSQILVKDYLLDLDVGLLESSHRNELKVLETSRNRLVIGVFLIILLMVLVDVTWISSRLARGIGRLRQGAARIGHGELEHRLSLLPDDEIADVAREINSMAASLAESFDSIRSLQEDVSRRNAELEVANRELEAFSYSVAHDLRAPLRSIDGFASILQEDYGEALGEEGRRLLGIIRSSGQAMDILTQDLLELTKAGKTDPVKIPVDMGALATETFGLCADPSVLAGFDFTVRELPAAMADRSMMRQVWLNLLSNAVKYSVPGKVHRIEVDGLVKDGMNVYSVRDHGAGFDQRYVGKLFGLFQRLHGSEEFQGTGIGLSIVKMIIERHGGKVWAEGSVGKGATFSFAIPTGEA